MERGGENKKKKERKKTRRNGARDLGRIVKAGLSRETHAYRRNRLAFGSKRREPVPPRTATRRFSTWNSWTASREPSSATLGESGGFVGERSRFRRGTREIRIARRRRRRKGSGAFIRETKRWTKGRGEGTPPRCQILFIAPWLFVSR